MKNTIIIATIKSWNIKNFYKLKEKYSEYNFILITSKKDLTIENISKYEPLYIFFPHWSWKISKDIFTKYNCIIFHETDLPFGRGGSPIQNLIIKKIYKTKISAIQCTNELDSGDIYLQKKIDISNGSVEKIFKRISSIIFKKMIPKILKGNYVLHKQKGEATIFKRRKPEDSNILNASIKTLDSLYDFIRMVDSTEYPRAYIETKNIKMEFSKVKYEGQKLVGKFEVFINE